MTASACEVTIMRGGTSKGVFVRLGDLPAAGEARDTFARALLGSPDPMQLDGLGGSHSSTSKLVAVGTPAEATKLGYAAPAGTDVAYLFAQIDVLTGDVDWRGNCGNLTAAVGPYAVHEGLAPAVGDTANLTLHNLNVGSSIVSRFAVRNGEPETEGDFALDGVPGTAARVDILFMDPAGSVTGALFPTGSTVDELQFEGAPLQCTIIDAGTPVLIVCAPDLGVDVQATQAELNADRALLERLERLRGIAAHRAGIVADAADALRLSPAVPRVVLADDIDATELVVRMTSMGVIHHALPATGLMAIAAARRLPGTIISRARAGETEVRVGHPKGVGLATVDIDASGPSHCVVSVGLPRTARRLLVGTAFLRTA